MKKCSPPGLCLVAAVAMISFLSLSYWQWTRSIVKRAAVEVSDKMKEQAASPFNTKLDDYSGSRYKPVTVSGMFLAEKQFLLDNQVVNRRAGYNVLTPFRIEHSNELVLVDRGWIAVNPDRSISTNLVVDDVRLTLSGTVYTPYSKGFRLGEIDYDSNWPRVIQYLDFLLLQDRLDKRLLPAIIRLDADSGPGFVRRWPVVAFGPEKHIGYMVQWLALAIAMLVFLIILSRTKHE